MCDLRASLCVFGLHLVLDDEHFSCSFVSLARRFLVAVRISSDGYTVNLLNQFPTGENLD